MSCFQIQPCNLEIETQYLWKLLRALKDGDDRGDGDALWEALDGLDMFALHTGSATLRNRALAALSTHGFHAEVQNVL